MLCSFLIMVLTSLVLLIGSVPAFGQTPPNAELHAIGIYEGVIRTDGKIHGNRAFLTVDRPGKDVTLFLSAYEPVTWTVDIARGSQVSKVILGGYQTQVVQGISEDTEVLNAFSLGGTIDPLYSGYEVNTPEFRDTVRKLKELTGLDMSSFQGAYSYSHASPFVVDTVQDDPQLLSDFPKGVSYTELPDLQFKAIYSAVTSGDRGYFNNIKSYGDFSLRGPDLSSLVSIPNGIKQIVSDDARGTLYGLGGHGVYRVELPNTKEEMDVGLEVPRVSWAVGLTFDNQRDRLLLATLGGEGFLYSFEPETDQWSVLSSMNNLDLSSLVYHEATDSLYGLSQPYGSNSAVLHRFTSENGTLIKNIELNNSSILPGTLNSSNAQLVSADDFLILLKSADRADPFDRMYLIDPSSGETTLVVPEPSTHLLLALGGVLLLWFWRRSSQKYVC